MSSGLLQVFVELGNLHGTSNNVLYWIHGGGVICSDSVSHNRVQVVSIMADHIWKEKGKHLPLWDEAEIIESAEN